MANDLGLSGRFFHSLIDEPNDWSFLIKCHALLETTICSWLASHFGDQELQEVFARKMNMGARIDMLGALKLANKQELTMMKALGTLRNRLVHNVQQTNFTFEEYFNDSKSLQEVQNSFVIDEDAEQHRLTAKSISTASDLDLYCARGLTFVRGEGAGTHSRCKERFFTGLSTWVEGS